MRYNSSYSASAAASPTIASNQVPSTAATNDFHYKKDGTLDMRYNSSYSASAATSPTIASNQVPSTPAATNDHHYKKDGTLDMRYKSSYSALDAASPNDQVRSTPAATNGDQIHLKKDGTPDMRFKSNRSDPAAVSPSSPSAQAPRCKKDGTPDMRFKSSKLERKMQGLNIEPRERKALVPDSIPVTKDGYPDMRNPEAKQWVKDEAPRWTMDEPPPWLPKKKDGALDLGKAIVKTFMDTCPRKQLLPPPQELRQQYYVVRQQDQDFCRAVDIARQAKVHIPPELPPIPITGTLRETLGNLENEDLVSLIPDSVPIIDYQSLIIDESDEPLGKGSFGVVWKGRWYEVDVAVKCLHINKLTKQEKKAFVKEVNILASLGNHINIVRLHGCCLEPPALVMEYVQLGNLNYLLHYCEDEQVEAKMTDGRIKKGILIGIAHGMVQLHATGIIHGDLKPQNVLITDDYKAKIADFGLARLRVKASSSVSSKAFGEDGVPGACGTSAYMAPELLDEGKRTNEKTDVYSFGILLNEVVQEQEPYYECYDDFHGKGPYVATMYAKSGHRPAVVASKTPKAIEDLIKACWAPDSTQRPSFATIAKRLRPLEFPHAF